MPSKPKRKFDGLTFICLRDFEDLPDDTGPFLSTTKTCGSKHMILSSCTAPVPSEELSAPEHQAHSETVPCQGLKKQDVKTREPVSTRRFQYETNSAPHKLFSGPQGEVGATR